MASTTKPGRFSSCTRRVASQRLYYVIGACILPVALGFLPCTKAADASMFDEGLMLRVPATMFNEKHFFVVDSGSSTTVLDKSLLVRLGSPITAALADTPYQSDLPTSFYPAPAIVLEDTLLPINKVVCIDLRMARMISGEPCSGVLGMDVLSNYVVTMDFEKKEFLLGLNANAVAPADSITVSMVPVGENRCGVTAVLNDSHNFILMIDSGSSLSVSLNKHDWDELFGSKAETVGRVSYFTGAGNKVEKNRVARLESLKVGTTVYRNLLCTEVPNPNSVSHLGLAFLRQNSVILDFPARLLHLLKRKFPPAEEDDMSGLHLLWQDGRVVIFAVDVGSPAESAGLKAGDQIMSVSGKSSDQLRMEQIRSVFQAGDGKKIDVTIKRAGKEFPVKITLKRFV